MSENPIQKIGRYEIEREIGRGGMAIVYKAFDPHLNRTVAIKLIRKGAFSGDQLETLPERFKREAWALARLNHPNIVQVYDYGNYEDMPYLVMEYLEGATLKEVKKPLKVASAVRILRPIAEALDYVHSRGLLHRDIKPSNIMITQDGEKVRLTDFGIAKFLDDSPDQHTLTGTGVGIGTPEYMAPEQGLGRAVDARSDQYALSVVFYELITGRKPFTGDTPVAILTKQAIEPFPDPREFVPDLNESVKRFFDRALAKNPADRYENMSDYLRDIDGLRLQSMASKGNGTTLTGVSAVKSSPEGSTSTGSSVQVGRTDMRRILETVGEKPDADALASLKSTSVKRVPWGALTFGLVALITLIAGVFGLQNQRGNSAAQTQAAAEARIAVLTAEAAEAQAQIERKTATEAEALANATETVEAERRAMEVMITYEAGSAETVAAQTAESAKQTQASISGGTSTAAAKATRTAQAAQTATEATYPVGNIIKFGRYEQDSDLSNGAEAIEWRELENDGETALIVSVMGLNAKPYHASGGKITWEESTLRAWLNNEFYNAAFNEEERARIALTEVRNEDNPEYSTDGGNDTEDYVFLLSLGEVEKYFRGREDRKLKPTKYATTNGAWTNGNNGNGWWWLRSPGRIQSDASGVDSVGVVLGSGYHVFLDNGSIRPALRIKLEN